MKFYVGNINIESQLWNINFWNLWSTLINMTWKFLWCTCKTLKFFVSRACQTDIDWVSDCYTKITTSHLLVWILVCDRFLCISNITLSILCVKNSVEYGHQICGFALDVIWCQLKSQVTKSSANEQQQLEHHPFNSRY